MIPGSGAVRNRTMARIDQRPAVDNPSDPDSPVTLELLLDLFARELEAGVAGVLRGVGDDR